MSTPRQLSGGRTLPRPPAWLRRRAWARSGGLRAALSSQVTLCGALVLLAVAVAVGGGLAPEWVAPSAMFVVVLLGVVVLRLRALLVLSVAIVLLEAALVVSGSVELAPGHVVVLLAGIAVAVGSVRSRERRGLQGAPGDLMLVDLRDRLVAHGRIPPLPPRWRVDAVVRSAYAQAFSGDFVVAARSGDGALLEIVLVDVSGKGEEAGVRSLLLSGAFGGLLGALPREQFLPAANRYLLEQRWPEGFATAVHLVVDLTTSALWVSSAGHPPAVHLHAGSGRVEVIDTEGGPALGVVDAPTFGVHEGRLAPGDTVMLYTDGLVERRGGDVEMGIDRLMGAAERFVSTRTGGAEALIAEVGAGEGDDRALILVHHD